MPAQRKLTDKTKGMFAGQAVDLGQYLDANLNKTSGTYPYDIRGANTRGEQQQSDFAFNQWPYMVSGMTQYDPSALQPGSNLSAVQLGARSLAIAAGLDGRPIGNPSGLNGMPGNI